MESAGKNKLIKFSKKDGKPTALVSGGTGFLGLHLSEGLIAQDFNVIVLDKTVDDASKKIVGKLIASPNFYFWEEDVTRPNFDLPSHINLNYIYHLACAEDYFTSDQISLQTLLLNSLGTKNLLDLAVEKKSKYILASSTEVFHGALSQISLETYFEKAKEPSLLTFGEAKRFAESLTAEYFKAYNLNTTIVRLKDPYGPRMSLDYQQPLANLIKQAVEKRKILLTGDGLRALNPTYISDIIFGLIKASQQTHKGEIFNLVNPEKYTERSIAETIKKIIPDLEINYKKGEGYKAPTAPLIIDPAQEKLGWYPKVSLENGLRETINFLHGENTGDGEIVEDQTTERTAAPMKAIVRKKPAFRKILILAISALLFWVILVPPIIFSVNIYVGQINISKATENILRDESGKAEVEASRAEAAFYRSLNTSENLFWPSYVPGLDKQINKINDYLFYAENVSAATKKTAQALKIIKQNPNGGYYSDKTLSNLNKAESLINQAEKNLQIAESVGISENDIPTVIKKDYLRIESNENELTRILESIKELL